MNKRVYFLASMVAINSLSMVYNISVDVSGNSADGRDLYLCSYVFNNSEEINVFLGYVEEVTDIDVPVYVKEFLKGNL